MALRTLEFYVEEKFAAMFPIAGDERREMAFGVGGGAAFGSLPVE